MSRPQVNHFQSAAIAAIATAAAVLSASGSTVVLQTDFGPGYYDDFYEEFALDWNTRPSGAETKQFFIDSGLDAQMSNGQMISDVATDAPDNWNPPYYNPLMWHTQYLGGSINFAPATSPLEIDLDALNTAVNANAAGIPVIRGELIKRVGKADTVVLLGEKADFLFMATDFGSGVSFHLFWQNLGLDIDSWYEADAQYSLRITVGDGAPVIGACCIGDGCLDNIYEDDCTGAGGVFMGDGTDCDDVTCPDPCLEDVNNDGVVDIDDIFAVLAAWGPCP